MNATPPRATQATAAPATPRAAAGAAPTTDAAAEGDAAQAFLGVLEQATTSLGKDTSTSAPPFAVVREQDDTPDDPPSVDWSLPFVAPAVPAPPLDLELPDPGAGPAVIPGSERGTADARLATPTATLDLPSRSTAVAGPTADVAAPLVADAAAQVTVRAEAAPQPATHAIVRTVHVPVGDARWAAHVGHEVRLLVERGAQSATLRVSPEHLGPVEVRIDIVGDTANVVFGAAHADTRAALGDAIPRLREMLAGSGLALGEAGVRQDGAGTFGQPSPRTPSPTSLVDANTEPGASADVIAVRVGLVDAYA